MQTIAQATLAALSSVATTAESSKSCSGWRPTLDEWHPSLVKAADACARMIADMERYVEPYWLTLTGLPGSGKTMLAGQTYQFAARNCNPGRVSLWVTGHGIYDESQRRPNCVWLTAPIFKDRMMGGEYDLPEYLRSDYLVVIDDLGAQRDTAAGALADGLYRLADQRAHRWMIWTTNLTLAEIASRLDARISSRLIRDSNRMVNITAGDYANRKTAA